CFISSFVISLPRNRLILATLIIVFLTFNFIILSYVRIVIIPPLLQIVLRHDTFVLENQYNLIPHLLSFVVVLILVYVHLQLIMSFPYHKHNQFVVLLDSVG